MSDEQEVQTIPEVEQEARSLGWVPEENFRGDKSNWVDAETFVKRGKERLPLLQENNRRLKTEVTNLQRKVSSLETLFEGSQQAIVELKRFHEETFDARIKAEKTRLREEIISARENNDVRAELKAQEQLDELAEQVRDVTKKAAAPAPASKTQTPPQEVETPEFIAWRSANPWFLTNQRQASMAYGLAQQLRAENPTVLGKAFFDLLDEAIDEAMPSLRAKPNTSKVEGSRGGAGGSGAVPKSYSALPAEAKEVCDRQAKTFVGANKAFKTAKEWQDHYARVYFDKDL